MEPPVRQIGVFGGSFNPIHVGHIALARQLLTTLRLDEVWFVVSPLNPFKTTASDLLDDHLRYQMVALALRDEPGLRASDCEFHLPRPSYMYNTLCHLSARYPSARFTLLIGADNWLAFDRWVHAQDIVAQYRVAVYPREGYEVRPESLPPHVVYVPSSLYPVSSTLIRQRVRAGQSVAALVPPAILALVQRYYQ